LPLLLTIRANFPKASYTAVRLELCRPSDSHYHAGAGSSDNFTSTRSLCTDCSLHSPLYYSIPSVPTRILCDGAPVNVIFTEKITSPNFFQEASCFHLSMEWTSLVSSPTCGIVPACRHRQVAVARHLELQVYMQLLGIANMRQT